jgi:uncharacterized protein
VVTVIFTVPWAWAGVTATILVPVVSTVNDLAVEPNVTTVAVVRSVPVTVTVVVPLVDPVTGEKLVIVGAGATNLYVPADVAVPPGVVTVTFTGPDAWAGVTATILVPVVSTENDLAAVPNLTALAVVKLVPVTVTVVVPLVDPVAGAKVVIFGAGTANVYVPVDVAVPPNVDT